MCGHYRHGSCRDRREAGRIALARSGSLLERGRSPSVDRRATDCPPPNSGNEFCIILRGGRYEPGNSRKPQGFAREAGVWKSRNADEGWKPASDARLGGLRREIRALQFSERPREG